jgi:hypothetical protein
MAFVVGVVSIIHSILEVLLQHSYPFLSTPYSEANNEPRDRVR